MPSDSVTPARETGRCEVVEFDERCIRDAGHAGGHVSATNARIAAEMRACAHEWEDFPDQSGMLKSVCYKCCACSPRTAQENLVVRPPMPEAEPPRVEHDCGVRGKNPMIDPPCPACASPTGEGAPSAEGEEGAEHEDGDRAVGMYLGAIADVMEGEKVNPSDVELVRYAGIRLRRLAWERQQPVVDAIAEALSRPTGEGAERATVLLSEAEFVVHLIFQDRDNPGHHGDVHFASESDALTYLRALRPSRPAPRETPDALDPTVRGEWFGIAVDGDKDATLAVRSREAADRYIAHYHPDCLVAVVSPFCAALRASNGGAER